MPDRRGIKLLTIDDDPGLRRSIAGYFEDSGFTVFEAGNARDGLALFRQLSPDIVLTDLDMPNGNGLDLLPVLREDSPDTPVVVISGTGRLTDAVESMKRGAWDYLEKPVRNLSLLEYLVRKLFRQALDIRQQQHSPQYLVQRLDDRKNLDELTGLPNRTLLTEHFDRLSGIERRLTLILLDLDNFKMTNATLGPQAADQLLQAVAARLVTALGAEDVASRMGRDEFAVLSPTDAQGADSLVATLKGVFQKPFTVGEQELFVSAGMGVVIWPSDGRTLDDLLKHAQMSTYHAKERGRSSVQFYNPEFGATVLRRIEMENCLRRALEREEFFLHFQPQIDVASGSVAGVEALLRWRQSDGRVVPPSEIIPVLEESGLIIPVGEWILKNACTQYVEWRRQGMAPINLSVNISAPQFKSGELPGTVVRILGETGMDPAFLCIELTESIVMDDIEETVCTLGTLRELGISLSIDDFGIGYSSLNYLRMMPISELKIDQSFIATIPHDQNNAIIVNTIISMAHCMNIRVVAEGVETMDQLRHLSARQCQMAQGFYFSKPLPAEEVPGHLAAYAPRHTDMPA
jgi:diguanylate cyclase (GGDEF)-like protein